MITLIHVLTFLRVLIVLLSGETSIRYTLWWWETRKVPDALLISLMLGISLVHGALAAMIMTGLLHLLHVGRPTGNPLVLCMFGIGIIAGTFFHLVPCWQMSCGLTRFWVWVNLVGRIIASALITYILVAFPMELNL